MKGLRFIGMCLTIIIVSCAPPIYRAEIDRTASGGIIWPGKPERPRIKYLWSLQRLHAYEGETPLDLLAGRSTEDLSDPRGSPILLRPHGIYVDENRYYIADPGAMRVSIIERKDMKVLHILYADFEPLRFPIDVVSDAEGDIFVTDAELRRVICYNRDGKFKYFIGEGFLRPSGLAIDRERNRLYVVDTLGHKVYIYGTDGKEIGEIGRRGEAEGEFNYPGYAFVDSKGYLYVTDSLNFRIQIFNPQGDVVRVFGKHGDAYHTLDKPKGVAVDSEGHIYVVDAGMDMVKIFDRQGRLLLFFGEKGHGYGKFYLPSDIFIDENDVIYVADTINMRIQAFKFLSERGRIREQ